MDATLAGRTAEMGSDGGGEEVSELGMGWGWFSLTNRETAGNEELVSGAGIVGL